MMTLDIVSIPKCLQKMFSYLTRFECLATGGSDGRVWRERGAVRILHTSIDSYQDLQHNSSSEYLVCVVMDWLLASYHSLVENIASWKPVFTCHYSQVSVKPQVILVICYPCYKCKYLTIYSNGP